MLDSSSEKFAPDGIKCMLMRGGTCKGAYFLADDLPSDPSTRDDLVLRIMGSPDPQQIDGLGGGQRSTSKVAIVSRSQRLDADIDYHFFQVRVPEAGITDQQTCGNLLAGVAPFAIERGLFPVTEGSTNVRIRVINDGALVIANVHTPNGKVSYAGRATISGVPYPSASISLQIMTDGRELLPSGNPRNVCAGIEVTCIDGGKPFVLINALDLGVTGYETPKELESNKQLRKQLEAVRVGAGLAMALGDVSKSEVPKLLIMAPARFGGTCCTRTFTPHSCHASIGLLGAVAAAAGLHVPGSVVESFTTLQPGVPMRIEHPAGSFDVDVSVCPDARGALIVNRIAVMQTARKIFDGRVWPRESTEYFTGVQ